MFERTYRAQGIYTEMYPDSKRVCKESTYRLAAIELFKVLQESPSKHNTITLDEHDEVVDPEFLGQHRFVVEGTVTPVQYDRVRISVHTHVHTYLTNLDTYSLTERLAKELRDRAVKRVVKEVRLLRRWWSV